MNINKQSCFKTPEKTAKDITISKGFVKCTKTNLTELHC